MKTNTCSRCENQYEASPHNSFEDFKELMSYGFVDLYDECWDCYLIDLRNGSISRDDYTKREGAVVIKYIKYEN